MDARLYPLMYQFDPDITYRLTFGRFKAEPGSGPSPNVVAVRFRTHQIEGESLSGEAGEAKILFACKTDWWPLHEEYAGCIRRIFPGKVPTVLQWSRLQGKNVLGRFGAVQPGGRNPLVEMRPALIALSSVPNGTNAERASSWPELDHNRFAIVWQGLHLEVGCNDMFRFLEMLIEARGRPVPHADLGERIFGDDNVSSKSLHSLKRRLKKKLESDSRFAPLAAGIRPSRGHYRFEL